MLIAVTLCIHQQLEGHLDPTQTLNHRLCVILKNSMNQRENLFAIKLSHDFPFEVYILAYHEDKS